MRLFGILWLLVKLYCVWFGAWLLGCVANTIYSYATARDFIFQGVNEGNLAFEISLETAVWSFPVAFITFPLVYAPLMFGLRRVLGGLEPPIVFTLTSIGLYIIPVALLCMLCSCDWVAALLSLQNIGFHIIFFFTGLFFGVGFFVVMSAREERCEALRD